MVYMLTGNTVETNPNVATLVSIAKLYNVTIDELVGYKTEKVERSELEGTHFEVIDMIKVFR